MKLKCPICGAPTDSETSADFPFCSDRCRILDLGNWASDKYIISSPAFDEDPDEIPDTGENPAQQQRKPAEDGLDD